MSKNKASNAEKDTLGNIISWLINIKIITKKTPSASESAFPNMELGTDKWATKAIERGTIQFYFNAPDKDNSLPDTFLKTQLQQGMIWLWTCL